MSINEASKKIGISRSKLYQLASARQIAHYRVGGKIIFTNEDIEIFLATCRVGAVSPTAPTATKAQAETRQPGLGFPIILPHGRLVERDSREPDSSERSASPTSKGRYALQGSPL